jgi:hypothetical protein
VLFFDEQSPEGAVINPSISLLGLWSGVAEYGYDTISSSSSHPTGVGITRTAIRPTASSSPDMATISNIARGSALIERHAFRALGFGRRRPAWNDGCVRQ